MCSSTITADVNHFERIQRLTGNWPSSFSLQKKAAAVGCTFSAGARNLEWPHTLKVPYTGCTEFIYSLTELDKSTENIGGRGLP